MKDEKNIGKSSLSGVPIKPNPEDPATWHQLGLDHLQRGEYVEAEKAFNQAVKLYPDFADALMGLAKVYEELGDTVRALLFKRKAQKVTFDNAKK
ncbi:MAG: tetratricopeptide repeat protein [Promethearchaeota archaeon]